MLKNSLALEVLASFITYIIQVLAGISITTQSYYKITALLLLQRKVIKNTALSFRNSVSECTPKHPAFFLLTGYHTRLEASKVGISK